MLFHKRTVWCPTILGGSLLAGLFALPCIWWFNYGEAFLSVTRRIPARVLVVEGWIGPDGIKAAGKEFEKGHYDLIVTSGGNPDPGSEDSWQKEGWTYAEGAYHQLVRYGIPAEKIIPAPPKDVNRQRTYTSALTVKEALAASGIGPDAINVFTLGAHARRSLLVYEKTFGPVEVGVIAWEPPGYTSTQWWHSSERSIEFLVQTVGFFYEFLFNSGRKT